ncbi:MAG: hypothetical protein ACRYG8_30505 [Janthinobacterium lividum]
MFEAILRWKRLLGGLIAIIIGDLIASAAVTAALATLPAPISKGGMSLTEAANAACMIAMGSSPLVALGTILLALVGYGLTWARIGGKARMIVLLSGALVLGCLIMLVFMTSVADQTNAAEAAFLGAMGAGFGFVICATLLIGERLLLRRPIPPRAASINNPGKDKILS